MENLIDVSTGNLNIQPDIYETPVYESIIKRASKLQLTSLYKTSFDFEIYRDLELRYKNKSFRGGITFKTPFKLVNHHSTCQQCLYAFEVDTYGRGCINDCIYCYAKEQLQGMVTGTTPIPAPVDITEIWKVFSTVFETDKKIEVA